LDALNRLNIDLKNQSNLNFKKDDDEVENINLEQNGPVVNNKDYSFM
jgi:hypothetical protein